MYSQKRKTSKGALSYIHVRYHEEKEREGKVDEKEGRKEEGGREVCCLCLDKAQRPKPTNKAG